ncbi:MAG: hypothetical protein J6K89_09685, partial [Oscillospiraceae bacterium]|nr:hypothetical protein [Oscillospiraceae bacterium]
AEFEPMPTADGLYSSPEPRYFTVDDTEITCDIQNGRLLIYTDANKILASYPLIDYRESCVYSNGLGIFTDSFGTRMYDRAGTLLMYYPFLNSMDD